MLPPLQMMSRQLVNVESIAPLLLRIGSSWGLAWLGILKNWSLINCLDVISRPKLTRNIPGRVEKRSFALHTSHKYFGEDRNTFDLRQLQHVGGLHKLGPWCSAQWQSFWFYFTSYYDEIEYPSASIGSLPVVQALFMGRRWTIGVGDRALK